MLSAWAATRQSASGQPSASTAALSASRSNACMGAAAEAAGTAHICSKLQVPVVRLAAVQLAAAGLTLLGIDWRREPYTVIVS